MDQWTELDHASVYDLEVALTQSPLLSIVGPPNTAICSLFSLPLLQNVPCFFSHLFHLNLFDLKYFCIKRIKFFKPKTGRKKHDKILKYIIKVA